MRYFNFVLLYGDNSQYSIFIECNSFPNKNQVILKSNKNLGFVKDATAIVTNIFEFKNKEDFENFIR
jgi:hypothetical protein